MHAPSISTRFTSLPALSHASPRYLLRPQLLTRQAPLPCRGTSLGPSVLGRDMLLPKKGAKENAMPCTRDWFTAGLRVGLALFVSCCVFSLAAAQTCVQPPTGLVSWWPGEENAEDIQSGNNGTLEGATTFDTGKVG
jgi:hypothetical protein